MDIIYVGGLLFFFWVSHFFGFGIFEVPKSDIVPDVMLLRSQFLISRRPLSICVTLVSIMGQPLFQTRRAFNSIQLSLPPSGGDHILPYHTSVILRCVHYSHRCFLLFLCQSC